MVVRPPHELHCDRDIALRDPRPRGSGRNVRIAPLDAARTARRAVPTWFLRRKAPSISRRSQTPLQSQASS